MQGCSPYRNVGDAHRGHSYYTRRHSIGSSLSVLQGGTVHNLQRYIGRAYRHEEQHVLVVQELFPDFPQPLEHEVHGFVTR